MHMTRKDCITIIPRKAQETGRHPKKSDFSNAEVTMIKSYFGPWPRALEEAGVKEPRPESRGQRRKRKRIEAKRARNAQRKILKKQNLAEKKGKVEE